jgi:metal-responsive CopG/Arc/MetJ family transcriptional regulator
MRTLIDIPEQQIADLSILCQEQGVSRAELIRRAINSYLIKYKPKEANSFGLWKKENEHIEDGLDYQQKLRNEW